MDNRDKIIAFIKAKGPVLPIQISKELNTNMIIAGAHLAELTETKKIKISSLKVGGSPLYFLAGQEVMLEKYATNLNEKEKKAFDLLKDSKVLKDSELPALFRVALREIRDFAEQLNVNYQDSSQIFWKWHSLTNEEAEPIIKSKLNIIEKTQESNKEEKVEEPKKEIAKEERQKVLEDITKPKFEEKAEKLPQEETKKKEKPKRQKKEKEDNFMDDIAKFFQKNGIKVINTEILKKNSEIDFIIEVPSNIGEIQCYCKAKNKKKINESELSSAYVKGQFKKLPTIIISNGEISEKGQEMLKNELKGLIFKMV